MSNCIRVVSPVTDATGSDELWVWVGNGFAGIFYYHYLLKSLIFVLHEHHIILLLRYVLNLLFCAGN